MARCMRCNKFLLIAPENGYCRKCELLNAQDRIREEQKLREEAERKLEEEQKRKAEKACTIERTEKIEKPQKQTEEQTNEEDVRRRKEPNQRLNAAKNSTNERVIVHQNGKVERIKNGQSDSTNSPKKDVHAQYIIGQMHKNGTGVPVNIEKARECFLKAISNGDQSAVTEIIGDYRSVLRGARQCRKTLKEDFDAFFNFIKKQIPVGDGTIISQNDFAALTIERQEGNFVNVNRAYFAITLRMGSLASNIANEWLKTLAASGDVKDAIALGEYVLDAPNVERINIFSWKVLEINTMNLKTYVEQENWSALLGQCIEFSNEHDGNTLQLDDIDVYQEMQIKQYTADDAKTDFDKAKMLYCNKHFDEAFPLLQKAAEFGNPEAQYYFGTCFDYGYGTNVDAKRASYWYQKAAEQGNADAQCDLGYNYKEGIGVNVDYQKAVYWMSKAVRQNHANAMVGLGVMYENGFGVDLNYKESFKLYKQAAELDNNDGASNTGIAYLIGRGVQRNPGMALKWNLQAATNGHRTAQFNLARQYLYGDGTNQNMTEGVYWLYEAASNGHPQAIAMLEELGYTQ